MSKYEPLKRHLAGRSNSEVPMTFPEVEAVLGFKLPNSARSYPAWWANSGGTHVNAAAWREAGWKTSRVDVEGERVTFVREPEPATPAMINVVRTVIAEDVVDEAGGSQSVVLDQRSESVTFEDLGSTERHCIELMCEELKVDRGSAMRQALKEWAVDRRRRFVEGLPRAQMPRGYDSTDLIRADRDTH